MSSLHAAILLEKNYTENLHPVRNTERKPYVTQKLVYEQKWEISGASELSWCISKWEELHLASDTEVIQLMKAKVYVFSDSVTCVWGKIHEYPQSNNEWETRLSWFKNSQQ